MNEQNLSKSFELLVCPETKLKLALSPLAEAEKMVAGGHKLVARNATKTTKPFGPTPTVLLREDLKCAYPIVDGIPILMVPEMLTTAENMRRFDLSDPRYAEAYQEMPHYNEVASKEAQHIKDTETFKAMEPVLRASEQERSSFPHPRNVWLDATYDCASQWDAYTHIAPVKGKRVLQLGGKGIHAVKFLCAGAEEAWVVAPMLGEVRCAIALAGAASVADRLRCVVGLAEELPFVSASFDVVYSGSCVHHTVTSLALPECARILRDGGKFGAIDPWRAPFYTIGTKIFGKREANVYCRPMTKERVELLYKAFRHSRVVHHGVLTRYPLLALSKLGISNQLSSVWWLNHLDDSISSAIPGLQRMGCSVALLGEK